MIFLAQLMFGNRLQLVLGGFNFIVEATSQEEAELKLVDVLEDAVRDSTRFPAPCRILLGRLSVLDRLPSSGLVFHQRFASYIDGDWVHEFPMWHAPDNDAQIVYDWMRDIDWSTLKSGPVPLMFVNWDRSISFPAENVAPEDW